METDWEPLRNLPKGPAHLVHSQNVEPRFPGSSPHHTLAKRLRTEAPGARFVPATSSVGPQIDTHTHTHLGLGSIPSSSVDCPPSRLSWTMSHILVLATGIGQNLGFQSHIYLPTEPSHHLYHYLTDRIHTPSLSFIISQHLLNAYCEPSTILIIYVNYLF